MNPFALLELEIEAARVKRMKTEAEEQAKADAVAAAAKIQRKVEHLTAVVARQQEWLENLTEIVDALRTNALARRPRRGSVVSARVKSCPLNSALEDGNYE